MLGHEKKSRNSLTRSSVSVRGTADGDACSAVMYTFYYRFMQGSSSSGIHSLPILIKAKTICVRRKMMK